MNLTNDLVFIAIAIMAVITFSVSHRVLDKTLFNGVLIPLAIAGLSFLGLWTIAREWIGFLLVEYATLALSILVVLTLVYFFRKKASKGKAVDFCRKPWTLLKGK